MEKRLKICFISPYFPRHFGGGEKYLLDCARVLSTQHQVSIAIPSLSKPRTSKAIAAIKTEYSQFFDLDLNQIQLIESPFFANSFFWQRLKFTSQFDLIYYQTDGSLFFSLAKKNILHIQIPFAINKNTFFDHLKLKNWQVINTNSEFTKQVIEKWWQIKVNFVHQPMISLPKTQSYQKEKMIVNVGRFFTHLHSKRQDVLITNFIDLLKKYPKEMKDWHLVLIGKIEDESYLDKLVRMAKGYPISFYHHLTKPEVNQYYQRSSIYWHAAGFEVDQLREPEKVEHFGIATAEAMSYGCIPIVVGKGGQIEVLGEELKQFLWQAPIECQEKTLEIIRNPELMKLSSQLAKVQAQKFSGDRFTKVLLSMVES